MRVAKHIAAELAQRFELEALPASVRAEFRQVKFSSTKCAAILEMHLHHRPEAARFFDPAAVARGDMIATDALVYARADQWYFGFFTRSLTASRPSTVRVLGFEMPLEKVGLAARVLRLMLNGMDRDKLRASLRVFNEADLETIFDPRAQRQEWPVPVEPGVYRREHASIVIQSAKARLVLDPVCMSHQAPLLTTAVSPDPQVDAVLITHSHSDHWHIPSLMASAHRPDTPVVVPHVPQATLLCRDMASELRAIGQLTLDPEWGSVLKFADIEVDVLPFYGEQPAVDARCRDVNVRNWGNCYRINTPDFSALVLADSGADPEGSMLDVVAKSVASRGPIDVVLACMRDFLSPFEVGGLDNYWMVLPFADLERLFTLYEAGRLPTTTAGLASGGIAKLCATARAGVFAPYAQGFAGIGKPIPSGLWGPSPTLSEQQALNVLEGQLKAAGVRTVVQHWNPGDSLAPGAPTLVHRRVNL